MPSTLTEYVLTAVRVILVGGGGLVAVGSVYALATMPPAPPESEGFVTGLAYIVGAVVLVLALGAVGLGIALPTLVGAADPLGFNRYQRWVLLAGGACFGGGFLLGLAVAVAVEGQVGIFVWLVGIMLGVPVVFVAVAWRLGEVAVAAVRDGAG